MDADACVPTAGIYDEYAVRRLYFFTRRDLVHFPVLQHADIDSDEEAAAIRAKSKRFTTYSGVDVPVELQKELVRMSCRCVKAFLCFRRPMKFRQRRNRRLMNTCCAISFAAKCTVAVGVGIVT